MVLEQRQKKILQKLIKIYQETAEPVGSKALAESGRFPVSPATLRNELAFLEKEGYLVQPHTSAGRVPTAKAYEWYLETIPEAGGPLAKVPAFQGDPQDLKITARELAEISGEAVFVAFGPSDTYYTGLSNLFRKPEFQNRERVVSLSSILDHLDQVVKSLFEDSRIEMEILIGDQCPFGKDFAAILTPFIDSKTKAQILIGLFGLLRMDWEKNIAIMNSLRK